jgi:hypothetical protein
MNGNPYCTCKVHTGFSLSRDLALRNHVKILPVFYMYSYFILRRLVHLGTIYVQCKVLLILRYEVRFSTAS